MLTPHPTPAEMVVVFGPCGAGKTTWARRHLPDHAHPDAEELARTLFADPEMFRLHPWVRAVSQRMLAAAVEDLLVRRVPVCVTIRGATAAERAGWVARAAAAGVPVRLVRVVTDPQTCVARAQADPRRPRSSRQAWPGIVANWFRDFTPVTEDERGSMRSYLEVTG